MPDISKTAALFSTFSDELSDGLVVLDGFIVTYINSKLAEMTGYLRSDLIGRSILDFVRKEDRESLEVFYLSSINDQPFSSGHEAICLHRDGESHFSGLIKFVRIAGSNAQAQSIGIIKTNIDSHVIEKRYAALEKEFHQILDNMPDVFYRTDAEGVITMISPACKMTMGYEPVELIGTKLADLYADSDVRSRTIEKLRSANGKPINVEATLIHKNGNAVWVSTNAYMRFDEKREFIGVEGIARDSTKRRNNEIDLYKAANTDHLTGLSNRLFFNVELSRAVTQSSNTKSGLALLYMDLDGFKTVNDTFGHQMGDELLCQVATRLRKLCRKTDLIARLGGDEFIVLIEDDPKVADVENIAKKIVEQLSRSFEVEGHCIDVGVSIGISYFSENSKDADDFLRDADSAMYTAKRAGKNLIRTSSVET